MQRSSTPPPPQSLLLSKTKFFYTGDYRDFNKTLANTEGLAFCCLVKPILALSWGVKSPGKSGEEFGKKRFAREQAGLPHLSNVNSVFIGKMFVLKCCSNEYLIMSVCTDILIQF